MTSTELREQIKKLPESPGIYIFSARGGSQPEADQPLAGAKTFGGKNYHSKPLYIGKALNLKNRVKGYLNTSDSRLKKMILESTKIEFIETDSDIEALILESQYIKISQPPFNIMLRDDKNYSYVGFTNETFPKIFLTHQPHSNKIRNPNIEIRNKSQIKNFKSQNLNLRFRASDFHSASAEWIGPFTDAGALKTTLQLLRQIFPYCTCKQTHNNYCLNYHIGKCLGFCCLKSNEHKNNEHKTYLKGIKAIRNILSGKKEPLIKSFEKEMRSLSNKEEFEKAMELQKKIEKIKRVFQNAQIIGNWSANRRMKIENSDADKKPRDMVKQLQQLLDTGRPLHRIEAYDIANIQGEHAVGAMAVFSAKGGPASGGTIIVPDRNQYRKFKITTPMFGSSTSKHGGDTGMLREMLVRRFNHPEWPYPDLIMVDGGKGQLSSATAAISKSEFLISKQIQNPKFKIPIIALTKNERHIGHKVITDSGKEIFLSKLPTPIKNLLLNIDVEAHRFAISYYRKIHRRTTTPKFTP